jgi:spore germination protein
MANCLSAIWENKISFMNQTYHLPSLILITMGIIGRFGLGAFNHQVTPIPTPTPSPPIELMAWLPWWDQSAVYTSLSQATDCLNVISPSWYHLTNDNRLALLPTVSSQPVLDLATASGLLLMPTVGNDLDSTKAANFLADPSHFSAAIDYLIQQAVTFGYQGYDLDFESIPNQFTPAYTQFLQLLADRLHTQGLSLSVAVHARTGSLNDWELSLSHDYASIGQLADQVRIMAYDFHYQNSPPGPVTPLDKLAPVLTYALASVPANKIVLGLPLYGYDWPENLPGVGVTFKQAQTKLEYYKGSWSRDPASTAPVGRYDLDGYAHTIWFEDAQSTLSKVSLARSLGIYRFIFWRLGGEDPDTWVTLASTSAILKSGK